MFGILDVLQKGGFQPQGLMQMMQQGGGPQGIMGLAQQATGGGGAPTPAMPGGGPAVASLAAGAKAPGQEDGGFMNYLKPLASMGLLGGLWR